MHFNKKYVYCIFIYVCVHINKCDVHESFLNKCDDSELLFSRCENFKLRGDIFWMVNIVHALMLVF